MSFLKAVNSENIDELLKRVEKIEPSEDFGIHGNDRASYNTNMSTVSKDFLDARLEAIEARMDARVAGMSAKLDATLAEIQADRHRFNRMESDVRDVKTSIYDLSASVDQRLKHSATEVAQQVQSLKSNIWFGVATTIASVLAVLALTYASFDSGRETSKSIAEATVRMEKLQTQVEAQAKAAAATPAPAPAPAPAQQQ